MRLGRYGLTFLFAVAPVAVSAQTQMELKTNSANQPYGATAFSRAHDDEHSRLERAHQQWHFEHDRGQRDRTYQREHELLHQRLTQAHNQWHAQYDPRSNGSAYASQDYGAAQIRERAAREQNTDSKVQDRRVRSNDERKDTQRQRDRGQNEDHR